MARSSPHGLDQALWDAINERDEPEAERLLRAGADPNFTDAEGGTCFIFAVSRLPARALPLFIERGADIDAADEDGWSGAFMAVSHGRLDVLRLLTAHGCDLHQKSRSGSSLAMLATIAGHGDALCFLAEQGVELEAPNHEGHSPAQWCEMMGKHELRDLLNALVLAQRERAMIGAAAEPAPKRERPRI